MIYFIFFKVVYIINSYLYYLEFSLRKVTREADCNRGSLLLTLFTNFTEKQKE